MAEQVFDNYAFFRDGGKKLQEDFIGCAKRHQYPKGATIFRVGDTVKHIYFVGAGALDVYVSGYTGRNVSLYMVGPGELCPINLQSVLAASVALANAKTRHGYDGAMVSAADFHRILTQHPDFRNFVIRCLAEKFQSIVRQIGEVTTRSVDARIEQFFVDHLDEYDEPGILLATNEQIGLAIGASREVVNRKLRALQDAGLVELGRGRIRVLEPERLLGRQLNKPCGGFPGKPRT